MKQIIMEGLPDNNPSVPLVGVSAIENRKITIFNEWLKAIATAVLVFVGICFGIVLIHVNKSLTKLDTTLDAANAEVANIETTRKSLDDLMVQTTTLIIDADTAATDETNFLKTTNTKLSTTLDAVNGFIAQATTDEHELSLHSVQALDATTTTVADIQPVLGNLQIATNTANDDLKIINQRLADPAIGQTLANVNSMTASGASILKDGADEIHGIVHPVKKKGAKAAFIGFLLWVHNDLIPKISLF